jgi:uncharacterized pyridoxamine 5'-phosphate oxidase family protein
MSEMNEAVDFLRGCGTFYVATCEGDQPRVRPFGALDMFEGRLYIVTNNRKKVFAQFTANPKLEICAMNSDGKWIRIAAQAVVDSRPEARAHMLQTNPGLQRLYAVDDGIMEVAYLKDGIATIETFAEPPKVIRLE